VKELYEAAGIKFDFSESYVKELMDFVREELDFKRVGNIIAGHDFAWHTYKVPNLGTFCLTSNPIELIYLCE